MRRGRGSGIGGRRCVECKSRMPVNVNTDTGDQKCKSEEAGVVESFRGGQVVTSTSVGLSLKNSGCNAAPSISANIWPE
jgi:hypothetical protein